MSTPKPQITNEQWRQIEDELKSLYCRAEFDYNGQELSITRAQTKEGRMDLAVFLDGKINWGWGWPNQTELFKPEVKAIWRKRSRAFFSPAKKKALIKEFGKRGAKQLFPNLDDKLEHWEPIFTSAAALVRQYKKADGLALKSIGHSTSEESVPAA